MKKAIIISIVFATLGIIFLLFARGKIIIIPEPSPAEISIDNKSYGNNNSLSLKLPNGQHIIKVEKEDYKTFEQTIKTGFFSKKEINAKLELTDENKDKKEIEKISRQFIEAWYNYNSQMEKEYLERIKPFMTDNFYEGTYYVNTRRPQDFTGQVPLKTEVKKVEIITYDNEASEVLIERKSIEPTTNKEYEKTDTLSLIKKDGKWFVDYLK